MTPLGTAGICQHARSEESDKICALGAVTFSGAAACVRAKAYNKRDEPCRMKRLSADSSFWYSAFV